MSNAERNGLDNPPPDSNGMVFAEDARAMAEEEQRAEDEAEQVVIE